MLRATINVPQSNFLSCSVVVISKPVDPSCLWPRKGRLIPILTGAHHPKLKILFPSHEATRDIPQKERPMLEIEAVRKRLWAESLSGGGGGGGE